MKCLRIYATEDGESHFGKVDIPTKSFAVHPDATPFEVSPAIRLCGFVSRKSRRVCDRSMGTQCPNVC